MENFSSKVTDTLFFGKYPSQEECDLIISEGVVLFVDLTTPEEITWAPIKGGRGYDFGSHSPNIAYIRCAMEDRTPDARDENQFKRALAVAYKECKNGNKVYIHCRGGHGRSGMLAAILLCMVEGIDSKDSLARIKDAHSTRTIMEPKWRKMGAPQTLAQKKFVKVYMDRNDNSEPAFSTGKDGYYIASFIPK